MEKNDFIFGIRAIIEAIRSGKTIDKLLVKKGINGALFQELSQLVKEHQIVTQSVPEQKLNRITRKNHQGVIAFLSPVPFYDITEIVARTFEEGKNPFFLYLDQISDVRNFGAIVRTAECAGVNAIIIPERGSAQITGDAMKTSAGALNHMPVCKVRNASGTIKFLQESGIKAFAASEKGTTLYSAVDYTSPCVVIMGSEDVGVSDELIRITDELVQIPILGAIESLNVSVAAGVLMYEVVKQRG